jgi:aminoglycoside phosphotransferase (APT) family kinase protein
MQPLTRTQAVREHEQLDWAGLDVWLKQHIKGLEGDPYVSQYPAGNSNLTYCLRYANEDLVVRRPPFGSAVKSAHSMSREYRIMKALKPKFDAVPEVLAYSDDESVIGAEFYVMRRVAGKVAYGPSIPAEWGFDEADTRRLCISFWSKLIDLHQVDYIKAGLADFGHPNGYVRRQIEGWNARMQAAATPDVETFEEIQNWLIGNLPETEPAPSVLHGDYRLDNVILDDEDPCKVVALLDWEICAIGNPLMDLGNALAYWVEVDDAPIFTSLLMQPSTAAGMLTRAEILQMYGDKTGTDVSGFKFYYTYGIFRNMVILQQIYYRYFHGKTQDKRFARFGQRVQAVGEYCRNSIA